MKISLKLSYFTKRSMFKTINVTDILQLRSTAYPSLGFKDYVLNLFYLKISSFPMSLVILFLI